MKKKYKLSLPATVLISSIILGIFIYASQVNKQKSIERQQEVNLREERRQQDLENAREELKLKQDECKALSSGVMKKWNNVMGVTYDGDIWKECVVTYTDPETGQVEKSPLSLMENTK